MSCTARSGSVLTAVIGVAAALCLGGCGSSKPTSSTASGTTSHASSSAVAQSSSVKTSKPAAHGSSRSSAINITSEAAYQRAVTVFLPCLRRHGVSVPQSDASLNLKGVDTSSPQFKHASAACRGAVAAAVAGVR